MRLSNFVVDLSRLGPGVTGVQLYALDLASYLERTFACRILAPMHLSDRFEDPITCGDPIRIRNSIVSRGRMTAGTGALIRSEGTFVYCPYMQGFLGQADQAITIHDLIAHRYPTRNIVERAWNRYLLPRLARRVRAIFTVSMTARMEVARHYSVPLKRIHVVPNALDLTKWRPETSAAASQEPYLLVVSANRVYKNVTELLLHHRLWAGRYRLKLVSTRTRYGKMIRAAVHDLELEHRVDFLDGLPERELIDLYRGSAAVVSPSLMEGFGRPGLEGMAVGRPVILSDIPVHLESFGDAAIFITPGDPASWKRAFSELDCDTASLAARIDRGLAIARRHTLENSCQLLTDALLAVQPRLDDLRNEPPLPTRFYPPVEGGRKRNGVSVTGAAAHGESAGKASKVLSRP
jgi:glycosyltransferase involved in cell wall biosynthesis